jgi:hypothetical protein
LLQAYLARRDSRASAEPAGDEWDNRLEDIRKAFEDRSGPIEQSFIAPRIRAAVALTSYDELLLVFDEPVSGSSADLVALLTEAERLAYTAWHRLSQYDRRLCIRLCYSIAVSVLRDLDDATSAERSEHDHSATLGMLRSRAADARQFLDLCASRTIAIRYVQGIVQGLVVVVAALAIAGVGLALADASDPDIGRALGAAAAGATGATVSVLSRITLAGFRKALPPLVTVATLGYEESRLSIRFIAALRPFMGAAFGAAAYAVAASSVRADSGERAEETFLYLAVAFAAGFSERFATDPVLRGGQRESSSAGAERTESRAELP